MKRIKSKQKRSLAFGLYICNFQAGTLPPCKLKKTEPQVTKKTDGATYQIIKEKRKYDDCL